MKYIDVSEWQGVIDWEKVRGNVDGVILRAGYGKGHADRCFAENAAACNRLGIPIGAYWFSYAKSTEEAREEARCLLAAVRPYRMELPLAYDFEYDSVANAKKCGVTVTRDLCSSLVHMFCLTVEAGGYWALNYANPDFLSRYFDKNVAERYGLWLASWPAKVDLAKPPRTCAIWQWGGSAVPGISGSVDTSEAYTDFCSVIRAAGCNRLREAEAEAAPTAEAPSEKEDESTADEAEAALEWARALKLIEGAGETERTVALALRRYHAALGRDSA